MHIHQIYMDVCNKINACLHNEVDKLNINKFVSEY